MVWLKNIEIHGYRGFAQAKSIQLAIPTGKRGAGLTIIVGPNNAGKSTVIESLFAVSRSGNAPSFTEGKRNKRAGDQIRITVTNSEGSPKTLRSVPTGGSETVWENPGVEPRPGRFFPLPSRRRFEPHFGKSAQQRESYVSSYQIPPQRGTTQNFAARLFEIQNHRSEFDEVLRRVLDPTPDWHIDQHDTGNYYLKFRNGDCFHNSDGMGDGLISLFFIIDALYDSKPGDIIVVDEPELSLHPHFQKRLRDLFSEYAQERQIVCATHSPYFIDWDAIAHGGSISRVKVSDNRSVICTLDDGTRNELNALLNDRFNPHLLGLEASEVFFLEDRVILVEGQEDVVHYPKILRELDRQLFGTFFGWGVGGAGKMHIVASILSDLGFERIVGLLDKNQVALVSELNARFPRYRFYCIPADDVRTKGARASRSEVKGLLDDNGCLRPEFRSDLISVVGDASAYLCG